MFLQHPFSANRQFRYLAVGVWNTLAGCGIYAGFYFVFRNQLHYLTIAVMAHLVAGLNSWVGFRYLVFHSKAPWLAEYLRFNLSCLMVLLFQLAGLWALVDYGGMHPIASQLVLVGLTVLLSYVVHSRFSFRQNVFQDSNDILH